MGLRFPIAVALGLVATFALFWIMQALIGVTGELKEGLGRPSLEFVRLRRDNAPKTKEREPPKREKPEQQPPPPEMNLSKSLKPGEAVSEIMPMGDTAAEVQEATSLGAGGGDRDVVPLVRVDPDYPPQARQRGIEGYVDLEFTIGPAGTVQNARVLEGQPPAIFDQAALRAVRRWRYNPKVVDGVSVARQGVQVRLRFTLAGS
jgi:protein TonB